MSFRPSDPGLVNVTETIAGSGSVLGSIASTVLFRDLVEVFTRRSAEILRDDDAVLVVAADLVIVHLTAMAAVCQLLLL